MREILFRGKRFETQEWIEGDLLIDGPKDVSIRADHCTMYEDVLPETVGQYTGLSDKNGTKIFEGDIFKFDDEVFESYYTSCGTEYDSYKVENYGVVGFDEDRGCYDFIKYKFNENSVEADLHENNNIEFAEFICELKVIGNIHDNPEMLEVTE